MLYNQARRHLTETTRVTDDNIDVTKRNYMTTDNNLSLLNDLYLCVSATRPQNMTELLEFLDVQIQIEEDVMTEQENGWNQ